MTHLIVLFLSFCVPPDCFEGVVVVEEEVAGVVVPWQSDKELDVVAKAAELLLLLSEAAEVSGNAWEEPAEGINFT